MAKNDGPEAGEKATTGGCLCGNVTYEIRGPLRAICACHCTQCRKASGHYVAATRCKRSDFTLLGAEPTWYKSSDVAERGFCAACGSNLFWRRFDSDTVSIWAGSIDGATGLVLDRQIHTDAKGDYYELPAVPIVTQASLT
jgi:hypothetical protein